MKAIAVAVAGLVLLAGFYAQAQSPQEDDPAQKIFNLTNQDRVQQGLPALRWSKTLAAAAAVHLDRMVQEPQLSHQYPGEAGLTTRAAQSGVHFQAVAENIAMGYSPQAIEEAWMHSTPHRTNILDPQMNAIGIAVVHHNGYDYAVEDFANAVEQRSPRQVEDRISELLRQQGIDPSGPRDQAEAACANPNLNPQGARAVIRFQTPDINQLPSQVTAALHSGHFTKAAVGACPPSGPQANFTTFRITVLLY